MLLSLVAVGLTLRAGLRMRRRRLRGERRDPGLLRRHLKLAKPAVAAIVLGFTAGPVSAWWLRDWTPFQTLHSYLGTLALALFIATAVLGHRLQHGRGRPVEAHAWLGLLAALAAGLAAFAGFVLLP